jgi:hypothetical protein
MHKVKSNLFLDAVMGAIVGSIVALVFTILSDYINPSKTQFPSQEPFKYGAVVALGMIPGVLGGLLFNSYKALNVLYSELEDTSTKLKEERERIQKIFDTFKVPLQLLVGEHTHTSTLNALTKASVVEGFNKIPNVDRNKYRKFLECAINESKSYSGINTGTIGSFYKQHQGELEAAENIGKTRTQGYLEILNNQSMPSKCRVFVIDDSKKKSMEDELTDVSGMARQFYNNNNANVKTYWITVSELQSEYNLNGIPDDCAIFDDCLILSYSEEKQILTFMFEKDNTNSNNINFMVFKYLKEQISSKSTNPFREISFSSTNAELGQSCKNEVVLPADELERTTSGEKKVHNQD